MLINILFFFFVGAVVTFGLLHLKEMDRLNIGWILATALFGLLLVSSALSPSDWKISVSNLVSFAVLCFAPLLVVKFVHRLPNWLFSNRNYAVIIGGFVPNTFHYAGMGIAYILGAF